MNDLRRAAQMALKFCETLGENQGGDRMPKTLCGPNLEEVLNAAGFFKRKPLTDEEILKANYPDGEENGPTIAAPDFELICFARQIEAAHNIKE